MRFIAVGAIATAIAIGAVLLPSGGGGCTAAIAANIYITQTAQGTGDGLSPANTQSAAYYNTPGNWGAGKPFAPGVTIGLCGVFTSGLTAQGSGTSGSPITIAAEPGMKCSMPVANNCLVMNNQSWLIANGEHNGIIEATDNGVGKGHQSGYISINADNCPHCQTVNWTIQNTFAFTPNPDVTLSATSLSGSTTVTATVPSNFAIGEEGDIAGSSLEQVTITNIVGSTLTITPALTFDVHAGDYMIFDETFMKAIQFSGTDTTVCGNTIHDTSIGIIQTLENGDDNVHVCNNDIYNFNHGYTIVGQGTAGKFWFTGNHIHGMQAWDNIANSYHHDGMFCYTQESPNTAHFDDSYIYNNNFDGDPGENSTTWIFMESQGPPCNDASTRYWVFNNKFLSTTHTTNNVAFSATGQVFFANNSVNGADPSLQKACGVGTISGGTYLNNAIGGCNQLIGSATDPTTQDYNAYSNCAASFNCFAVGTGAQWTASYSVYRANFPSLDVHSVADISAAFASNAAGVGENLTSMCVGNLVPLCSDINGAARPAVGAWTAGASN